MSVQAVLLPVFALVALTFALMFWLFPARGRALREGRLRLEEAALDNSRWGEQATKINNAYGNLLVMPVLFYLLVVLALFTRKADLLFVVLEWVYVVLRFVQASVHTTSNILQYRGGAFVLSTLVLAVMWVIFAVRILVAYGPVS